MAYSLCTHSLLFCRGKNNLAGKRSVGNVSIAGSQASFGTPNKIGFRTSKSTLFATGSRKTVAIDERSQRGFAQKAAVQVITF